MPEGDYHHFKFTNFTAQPENVPDTVTVTNIEMTIYDLNDPTCSTPIEDMNEPKRYVVFSFVDMTCTTLTITEPYLSVLGNIIYREDFPSFAEVWYMTSMNQIKSNQKQLN